MAWICYPRNLLLPLMLCARTLNKSTRRNFFPQIVLWRREADSHGPPCLSKDLEGSLPKQQEMKRLGMIETRATVREIGRTQRVVAFALILRA